MLRFNSYIAVGLFIVSLVGAVAAEDAAVTDPQVELDLLRRRDVAAELMLSEEQREEMERLARSSPLLARFNAERAILDERELASRWKAVVAAQADLKKSVLRPRQLERLEELHWQAMAFDRAPSTFAVVFDLTDEQKERLAEKQEELGKELVALMRRRKNEAHAKMLDRLTPKQQEQWRSKVGQRFEFDVRTGPLTPLQYLH